MGVRSHLPAGKSLPVSVSGVIIPKLRTFDVWQHLSYEFGPGGALRTAAKTCWAQDHTQNARRRSRQFIVTASGLR